MNGPADSQRPGSFIHSPIALMLLVLACAAVLWFKLESINQNLASHVHPLDAHDHVHDAATDADPVHQHGPFHGSTHPPSGQLALVPEWSPVAAMALALPAVRATDAEYLGLLADLTQACLEHTSLEVIVVVEQEDVKGRARYDGLVGQRQLERRRIRFLETKSLDSIWIRDYGPIFVRRRDDGQLFVIDAAYRDARRDAEFGAPGLGPVPRPGDDLVPIYFSTSLDKPYVHPGFALNGGDLYADGQASLFTSEETLHLNTGDREFLASMFRQYFGVEKVHYLRSLPGPTVKHIDMVFKLASPRTCLVGRYAGPATDDEELASLQRAAAETLDSNADYLTEQGLRVVRLPMPNITKATRWDYLGRLFDATEREARVAEIAEGAKLVPDAVRERLQTQHVYAYRTYLNSVLLVSGPASPGRTLLVPRYGAAVPEELEAEVTLAYREAYGADVEIVYVDAETLALANGSLRCIVSTVPSD